MAEKGRVGVGGDPVIFGQVIDVRRAVAKVRGVSKSGSFAAPERDLTVPSD